MPQISPDKESWWITFLSLYLDVTITRSCSNRNSNTIQKFLNHKQTISKKRMPYFNFFFFVYFYQNNNKLKWMLKKSCTDMNKYLSKMWAHSFSNFLSLLSLSLSLSLSPCLRISVSVFLYLYPSSKDTYIFNGEYKSPGFELRFW